MILRLFSSLLDVDGLPNSSYKFVIILSLDIALFQLIVRFCAMQHGHWWLICWGCLLLLRLWSRLFLKSQLLVGVLPFLSQTFSPSLQFTLSQPWQGIWYTMPVQSSTDLLSFGWTNNPLSLERGCIVVALFRHSSMVGLQSVEEGTDGDTDWSFCLVYTFFY